MFGSHRDWRAAKSTKGQLDPRGGALRMGPNRLTIAAYRALLRQAGTAKRDRIRTTVLEPVEKGRHAWGRHRWTHVGKEHRRSLLEALLPGLNGVPEAATFSSEELKQCIRLNFRRDLDAERSPEAMTKQAMASMRILGEQLHLNKCSSSANTRGVQVDVTSASSGSKVSPWNPGERVYDFSYRIRLANRGTEKVQLIGRHWIMQEAGHAPVVLVPKKSPGVVGQLPVLLPGADKCFEYVSGVQSSSPRAQMWGSFQMTTIDEKGQPEEEFDARVAPFNLVHS
eukprot:evm.model.scf_126.6 EVM.evm.TU.scf_126.6   scf_126:106126-113577(+)